MRASGGRLASLRYNRPYWMLHTHLKDENWRIYTVMHEPEHQRVEMTYQAWLGGLDRPYARPRCMVGQPLWLEKKRHAMQKPDLDGPETPLERYVLQWRERFETFRGTLRPTTDDLHTAFDLVERPLDLSYALRLLDACRNDFDIHFADDTFTYFLEACLRVDREDVAKAALDDADRLGFWHVDENVARFVREEQPWYRRTPDGVYLPLERNEALNGTTAGEAADKLQAELAALEKESAGTSVEDEEARLLAELEALEAEENAKK